MLDFVINSVIMLASFTEWVGLPTASDCSVLGASFKSVLEDIFSWIQIAVPCLVIVLCSVDMAKAVISQDDKSMQSALSNSIKRVCVGVAIFFVPILVNFLLYLAGFASGTCSIGG